MELRRGVHREKSGTLRERLPRTRPRGPASADQKKSRVGRGGAAARGSDATRRLLA